MLKHMPCNCDYCRSDLGNSGTWPSVKLELYERADINYKIYRMKKERERMDAADRKKLEDLARKYGIGAASYAERAFLEWLLKRPRIARVKWLAKLLYNLTGGADK